MLVSLPYQSFVIFLCHWFAYGEIMSRGYCPPLSNWHREIWDASPPYRSHSLCINSQMAVMISMRKQYIPS
ncbi:hypothetical protein Trydic_g1948 [Trypoxylus dichotomus]